MSRRLVRTIRTSVRALIGATLALSAAHATPPEASDAPPTDADDGSIPGEAAIFGRFGDLGDDATRERLDALLGNDDTAERLYAVTSRLAAEGVTAKAIERLLLPLIAGLEEEAVDRTLAAVLLDTYESGLQARLESGDLGVDDVMAALEQRADVVVTAAYGSVEALPPQSPEARAIRSLKRRI
ncbi:MAG: hypothetical protein H6737_22860 [Alphaproteobacteria bacterium]|nr:hypothetical protein [Alphaproteobacteria bacterium]